MENKSILIKSDEVTKNMMSEIQEDMTNSLSKVSRNMSEDIIEKLKPLEKKINDLKGNFQEFQEDDFEEKIEDLNNNILKITKSIEGTIEIAVSNMVKEQNKVLFESIEERLAILGLKVVKDAANNKEAILNKIDDINVNKLEEKVELLEKSIEHNLDNKKNLIIDKINDINKKIEDKDILIELINKLQDEFNTKVENIKEEVEWGNKSLFARIFGKRRK